MIGDFEKRSVKKLCRKAYELYGHDVNYAEKKQKNQLRMSFMHDKT